MKANEVLKILGITRNSLTKYHKTGLVKIDSIINKHYVYNDDSVYALLGLKKQNHKKIKFAGYNMPHPLEQKVLFHYDMIKEDNIKDILGDVVKTYKKIFNTIKSLL